MHVRPSVIPGAGALIAWLLALPAGATAAPADWAQLEGRIAAPWPALQEPGGHFRDYIITRAPGPERDDYGDAMLGYALLREGIRAGDRGHVDAGLRGLTKAAGTEVREGTAMFRNAALAGAYNLARERLPDDPAFAQSRPVWEETLRSVRLVRIGRGRPVTNKSLVEAVAVLETARSGISGGQPGTVVADPAAAVAQVKLLLGTALPGAARRFERRGLSLIGDFPDLPLAYHALAVGFLARAVDLLGADAPAAARAILGRAAKASLAFAAPDGDLTYAGRSQAQSWALAMTAFAAETAARVAPDGPALAARYRALADRAIGRLEQRYTISDQGLLVTPALAASLDAGVRGLEDYVAAAPYNGLTLIALDWALDAASDRPVAMGRLPSDADKATVLGTGAATFAAVRRGNVWFAVRQAPSASRGSDLRYDFGLVALKVRRPDGGWDDVLPARPIAGPRRDSAGPTLLARRRAGFPAGRSLRLSRGGAVSVPAYLRTASGATLRRGVRFAFAPVACGVRISFPARSGDRFEYSAFFPAAAGRPAWSPGRISGGVEDLVYRGPGAVTLGRGYASSVDPELLRARLRFRPGAGRTSITVCRR